jgi:hypothetical protein
MRFGKVGGVVDAEWDYRGLCWSYTIKIRVFWYFDCLYNILLFLLMYCTVSDNALRR